MNKVKVITDSFSDLTNDLLEKYNIDYIRMNILKNNKSSPANLNWSTNQVHNFYNRLRNGEKLTVELPSLTEINSVFTKYLKDGYDILFIGCSAKNSAIVKTVENFSKELKTKFPEQNVYSIDSFNASMGEGLLAIEAAKLVREGKTIDEIKLWIIENRKKVNQFVSVNSLKYLKESITIKNAFTILPNIRNLKQIIISDIYGNQTSYKKIKGRENSLKEIVDLMNEKIISSEQQTIYIAHSDCSKEEVQYLVNLIKTKIPCKEIQISYIGPVIGSCVGPDAIGIWSFGQDVTFSS